MFDVIGVQMQSLDNVYNLENVDAGNNLKDDLDSVDSSVVALAERVNFASNETSREVFISKFVVSFY